jgi:alpha-N-arabinofuranosidase
MANFTMMTSLLSYDQEKGYYKSPWFYAFKLFSNNCLGTSVDTYVQCDTFSTAANKGIPYLDVTSVYNKEKGSIFVNVVNRNADKAITADVSNIAAQFTGKAQINSLEGDAMENFTYTKQDSYKPLAKQVEVKNGVLTYSFPAHSITQIELKIK